MSLQRLNALLGLVGEQVVLRNLVATLISLLLVLLARRAALSHVRRSEWPSDQLQLKWTVQIRRVSVFIALLSLLVIWLAELRTLALSAAAVAAAVVLAIKELLLCLTGSGLRSSSRAYSLGDRIELSGVRGDVIDVGAFTTTVLEIGPGHRRTGRAVTLPNSLLLGNPVINETFTQEFVLHQFGVPVDVARREAAEATLLKVAEEVCGEFVEQAHTHMDALARQHGLRAFPVTPSVSLQLQSAESCLLMLRVPTPARDKGTVEQRILRRFLSETR